VLAALITSRDKGTLFIYRKALEGSSAHVRRLGCIGLGALGDSEGIKDLEPMLTDSDKDVQLAAALALASIGTDRALELITNGLLHGEQSLKRAVAEALAAIPGVGPATLREAITSPDVELRRAAVFGLARVKAVWSLAQLYRSQMEDSEWYVRDAAKQSFNKMESPERGGILRHPDADELPWLAAWAAERGDGVPAGPSSREVLVRALQDADPVRRAAAAQTLAALGHVPALKPLYKSLHDGEETVRAAAYGALVNLQNRLGEPLPAVAAKIAEGAA
jgi:HEAT repeat protein